MPNFGLEWKKPTHPTYGKSEGMENVVSKRCITPYCETIADTSAYDGYCLRCFMYTFSPRNYKTKEQVVGDHVQEYFGWIADKRISDGCWFWNRHRCICHRLLWSLLRRMMLQWWFLNRDRCLRNRLFWSLLLSSVSMRVMPGLIPTGKEEQ